MIRPEIGSDSTLGRECFDPRLEAILPEIGQSMPRGSVFTPSSEGVTNGLPYGRRRVWFRDYYLLSEAKLLRNRAPGSKFDSCVRAR